MYTHAQPFYVKKWELIQCSRFVETSPEAAQPDKAISHRERKKYFFSSDRRTEMPHNSPIARQRLGCGCKRSNMGSEQMLKRLRGLRSSQPPPSTLGDQRQGGQERAEETNGFSVGETLFSPQLVAPVTTKTTVGQLPGCRAHHPTESCLLESRQQLCTRKLVHIPPFPSQ